eukprot:TRINITY_DN171_c0_g1_i4.p1 TRINITY_DN171_c0_g1~~TRINITY_DN171_c0_g1_i4.p1  ORF type:complete len:741 (+),score=159.44 TRINITY_DN171_c0_g1_i4:381-2603(+)
MKHVEYILLAEFDIDVGSTVKYQYPHPCGLDVSLLAEFMLPDGAHKRDDDWTLFFLNRKGEENNEAAKNTETPTTTTTTTVITESAKDSNNSTSNNNNNNSEKEGASKDKVEHHLEAFIYKFSENDEDQGWVMLSPTKMDIVIKTEEISISSSSFDHKIIKHTDLECTQLEPLFSVVLVSPGVALGFRFTSEDSEKLFLNKINTWVAEIEAARNEVPTETPTEKPEENGTGKTEEVGANSESNNNNNNNEENNGNSNSESSNSTNPTTTQGEQTASNSTNTSTPSENTPSNTSTPAPQTPKPFLYCLNFMNNLKDKTVRRGAMVKSIAICTIHQYVHIYKPFMILALQKYFANPGVEVLEELYHALNNMDVTHLPLLNDNQKMILRTSSDPSKQFFPTTITYSSRKMNIHVPLSTFGDEIGDNKVISLVQKFGMSVMIIYNALLQQRRILFLGNGSAAGEVCNYVLAALAMVCPPLRGLVNRCYPYTNLCYLDFLSVPGYVTGVTNPMFEEHPEWWDILCNIQTGKVTLNPKLVTEEPDKWSLYDTKFIQEVTSTINAHYGEDKVRSLFQDYTQHLADMTMDEEEWSDDLARTNELEANRLRLDAWRRTFSYSTYVEDRIERLKSSFIRDPLIPRYIRKLRKNSVLPEEEVLEIYKSFISGISTEEQLTEFLSFLPEANGGLYPVAVSLFHCSQAVRRLTVELFSRLNSIKTGSGFISGLNQFLILGYDRNLKLLNENGP